MSYKKDVQRSQKELKLISRSNMEIFTKANYGPSKPTRIPLVINEELACFIAAIIGDGHLKKSKFQITIECSNEKLIEFLKNACARLFLRKFNISPRKKIPIGRKERFCLIIDSKAIHNLLHYVFEIPIGKKSDIVKVPEYIKKNSKSIKSAFLMGIMATEGGKRRRGYGLSTASRSLWKDLIIIFEEVGIPILTDKWVYKKYNKEYYGIVFKKNKLGDIINACNNPKIREMMLNCKNFD